MAVEFEPKLSILPPEQYRLWNELGELPETFVLCGGTAIALQLGHRSSIDFDFLSSVAFDPDELYTTTGFLDGSEPIQKAPHTLTCIVDRGGSVQVSFFGAPSIRMTSPPLVAKDNRLHVAALVDLAAMKAAVVQKRAQAKDYLDLDAIIQSSGIDLATALATAKAMYGTMFSPLLTLKSLSFFGDGDLPTLNRDTQMRLATAAKQVDLNKLPDVPRV